MNQKAIGKRIKEARECAHLTQEMLAGAVGCTSQHISVIERGLKAPKLDTFVKIANTVGVSADVLLQDVLEPGPAAEEYLAVFECLSKDTRFRVLKALRAYADDT